MGRVRTRRAGWNGLRGRGVCGARSRREVSLPLAVGRRKLVASARIAPHSCTRARRAPASRHPTQTPIRGSKRECVRKPPLRFCIVPSLPQKSPTQNARFSFPGAHGGFNGSAISHVTGTNVKSRGFKSSLNATKWSRVQPKLASAALHGFFFSLPRAHTGVRSHNGTRERFPRLERELDLRSWRLTGSLPTS